MPISPNRAGGYARQLIRPPAPAGSRARRGGIVVAKLDRLSRSVVDAGALLEEARDSGWNIVALDFGLDFSTPQGELVANVLSAVAQWERRVIGQRTKEGLAVKKARTRCVRPCM